MIDVGQSKIMKFKHGNRYRNRGVCSGPFSINKHRELALPIYGGFGGIHGCLWFCW